MRYCKVFVMTNNNSPLLMKSLQALEAEANNVSRHAVGVYDLASLIAVIFRNVSRSYYSRYFDCRIPCIMHDSNDRCRTSLQKIYLPLINLNTQVNKFHLNLIEILIKQLKILLAGRK